MLIARWVVAVTAVLALASGCGGDVVETGPSATVGQGFSEVVVTEAPTTSAAPTGTGTTVAPSTSSSEFEVGDCLWWDVASTSATFMVVPCAEEHLVEVAGPGDLAATFAPEAAFPTPDELRAALADLCGPIVERYLGRVPEDGIEPGVIAPTEATWSEGDRVAWCTVGKARRDGARLPYTGSLADGTAG